MEWHITGSVRLGSKFLILQAEKNRTGDADSYVHVALYNPVTDKWKNIPCTGDRPSGWNYAPQIIADKMYVLARNPYTSHEWSVYRLDLRSYHWDKLEITGVPPIMTYDGCLPSTWAWKDKVYIFGGTCRQPGTLSPEQDQVSFTDAGNEKHFSNQCVALNTTTHQWEWPRFCGDAVPSPRSRHKTIVDGDIMLLFGGCNQDGGLGDLHALHLPTQRWSTLQTEEQQGDTGEGLNEALETPTDDEAQNDDEVQYEPMDALTYAEAYEELNAERAYRRSRSRPASSFTSIGKNKAMLYFKYGFELGCWLLDWTTTSTGIRNIRWSPWSDFSFCYMSDHAPQYSPDTFMLYLLRDYNYKDSEPGRVYSHLAKPPSLSESSKKVLIQYKRKLDKKTLTAQPYVKSNRLAHPEVLNLVPAFQHVLRWRHMI